MEGRLSQVEFKYLEHSLVDSPLYDTYKESIKLRETKNYELTEQGLHKELFQEGSSSKRLVHLSEESVDFGFQRFMTCS
jgi:hypothetical protein